MGTTIGLTRALSDHRCHELGERAAVDTLLPTEISSPDRRRHRPAWYQDPWLSAGCSRAVRRRGREPWRHRSLDDALRELRTERVRLPP